MNLQHVLERCVTNDRQAQKQLYEHYYAKMMGVCYRYTDNHDDAREIYNDSFFKVFSAIEKKQAVPEKVDAWIYRIIINTAIDHYRKTARKRQEQDIEQHPQLLSNGEDAISKLSAEEIIKMVQMLSPAYRTVFNLYAIDGFTHAEIGEQLGIAEGTSKSNYAKARMKLQEMIVNHQIKGLKNVG